MAISSIPTPTNSSLAATRSAPFLWSIRSCFSVGFDLCANSANARPAESGFQNPSGVCSLEESGVGSRKSGVGSRECEEGTEGEGGADKGIMVH